VLLVRGWDGETEGAVGGGSVSGDPRGEGPGPRTPLRGAAGPGHPAPGPSAGEARGEPPPRGPGPGGRTTHRIVGLCHPRPRVETHLGAQPIALRSDAAGIEALMLRVIPPVRALGAIQCGSPPRLTHMRRSRPWYWRPAGARVGGVLAHTGDGAHAQHGGLVEDLPRRQVPYPGATAPRVGEPQQSRRSLGGNGAASSMLPNGPFYNPQHKCRWMGMLRRGG